jgi:exopolysaccharide biosynthesis polyprenyl glycosylphosphotransferase
MVIADAAQNAIGDPFDERSRMTGDPRSSGCREIDEMPHRRDEVINVVARRTREEMTPLSSPDLSPKPGAQRFLPEARTRPVDPAPERDGLVRSVLYRLRAWMLVLPVDAVMLMAPGLWAPQQFKAHMTMGLLFVLLVTRGGRYRARLHLSVLDELPGLLTWLLTCAALVATVSALRHDTEAVATFLDNAAIAVCLVVAGRLATTWLINWSRRRRLSVHPTVVIGGGPLAAELVRIVGRYPRYGLSVVGYVEDGTHDNAAGLAERLGGTADLDAVVRATGANVLLVADGDLPERTLLEAVRTPASSRCDLLIVPRLHHFATQTGMTDHIGSIPIMRIQQPSLTGPARLLKRGFDLVVGGLALVVVAPVILVCALAVRIDGGPGVIFRQTRVGRDGELFELVKLRTIRADPAAVTAVVDRSAGDPATEWSVSDPSRVSPLGRLLRRLSLDELPQIWNVLRGDMTLVGPRPERPYFVEQFSARYDRYGYRHRVQVGLTGLAQVSGLRGDTSIADRARHDNYYIENWSLWLDMKIIIRTFFEVFLARGR